jgi:hypothetical protein
MNDESENRGWFQKGHGRPGPGRPKGSRSRMTMAQREACAKTGVTPLEFLLSIMRDPAQPLTDRITAAHHCLPYLHAKLATRVEVSGPDDGPIDLRALSDAELEAIAQGRTPDWMAVALVPADETAN